MADNSQNELVFESEEARQNAIDALPESPDNESKLDVIMQAPIKAGEAAQDNPADPPKGSQQEPVAEEVPSVSVEQPAVEPQSSVFSVKKEELPDGFDSPGKLFKSYREAQELIERQKKFIKEKIGGDTHPDVSTVLQRAEAAERELDRLRKQHEKPAQQETAQEGLSQIPESNKVLIRSTRTQLADLYKDPIANEDEIIKKRLELDDLIDRELERTELLITRSEQRVQSAEERAAKVEKTVGGVVSKEEQSEKKRKAEVALQKDHQDIDEFCRDYPEFKLSKKSSEVEEDYLGWGAEVSRLYYGQRINVETEQGIAQMRKALMMLEKGAPDIVEKCNLSGIPTEPTEDIKKYLDVGELLDYRDGYRMNPITGKYEQVTRFHGPSGKEVPDIFPSLKAAYENRKVLDGHYADRIRESFIKGGASMAQAATRVDNGSVEMGNSGGASRADAGVAMTIEEAERIVDTIDEVQAHRLKKAGDPSLYTKLVEAMRVLGTPIEV